MTTYQALDYAPDYVTVWGGYLRRLQVKGPLPITFHLYRDRNTWYVDCKMKVQLVETGNYGSISYRPEVPTHIMSEPLMQEFVMKWCRQLYLHELREHFFCDGKQADPPHDDHYRAQVNKLKPSFWDRFFRYA